MSNGEGENGGEYEGEYEEAKEWTRSCGLCKKQSPETVEFRFSDDDIKVSPTGRVYVQCPKGHLVWLKKKEDDESLRDAIETKLNDPETVKQVELAKRMKKIEKENKKKRKEEEEEEKSDHNVDVDVEEMLEGAGIGSSYSPSMPAQHTNTPDTFIPTHHIDSNQMPDKRVDEMPDEMPDEGVDEMPDEEADEMPDEWVDEVPDEGVDEVEIPLEEMEWKCMKCGSTFSFTRSNIIVNLETGKPGFYVVCPRCGAHNGISRMEKYARAKKELAIIFPKKERDAIISEEVDKKKSKEESQKKKAEKKTSKEEEIFMTEEIPEASESGYVYKEPTIKFGEKEYIESELVETWGMKGMNIIKRKRLEDGLLFVKDKSLVNGILYRFDTSDEVKNNPRFLFDTITKYVKSANPGKVEEVVDRVMDVNREYGSVVGMAGYYPSQPSGTHTGYGYNSSSQYRGRYSGSGEMYPNLGAEVPVNANNGYGNPPGYQQNSPQPQPPLTEERINAIMEARERKAEEAKKKVDEDAIREATFRQLNDISRRVEVLSSGGHRGNEDTNSASTFTDMLKAFGEVVPKFMPSDNHNPNPSPNSDIVAKIVDNWLETSKNSGDARAMGMPENIPRDMWLEMKKLENDNEWERVKIKREDKDKESRNAMISQALTQGPAILSQVQALIQPMLTPNQQDQANQIGKQAGDLIRSLTPEQAKALAEVYPYLKEGSQAQTQTQTQPQPRQNIRKPMNPNSNNLSGSEEDFEMWKRLHHDYEREKHTPDFDTVSNMERERERYQEQEVKEEEYSPSAFVPNLRSKASFICPRCGTPIEYTPGVDGNVECQNCREKYVVDFICEGCGTRLIHAVGVDFKCPTCGREYRGR